MEKEKFKSSTTKCSQCGQNKFTNPSALAARLKKWGSIEEIEKHWICRTCTTANKKLLTNQEVDKKIQDIPTVGMPEQE